MANLSQYVSLYAWNGGPITPLVGLNLTTLLQKNFELFFLWPLCILLAVLFLKDVLETEIFAGPILAHEFLQGKGMEQNKPSPTN